MPRMFTTLLYVQVRVDRMTVRNVSKGIAAERAAQPPFSHKRSLVGDFTAAEKLLKALVKEVQQGLVLSVSIVIHPMERIEGGLSQIEERALRELAIGAGASRVAVWVGDALTDEEVAGKLKGS